MTDPIGLAVLGAGRIGRIHAANIASRSDAVLVWVVDVDRGAAETLAGRHGAQAGELDAVLEDERIDAVIVAASTDTHLVLIEACLGAGKAVLCEKPLDLDVERARRARSAASRAAAPLFVGFNRRFDPGFERVKREITSGAIGHVEVLSIVSRDPSPPPIDYVRRSGGLFRDMMIHDFDMARWLLGETPVAVSAHASCLVDPAIGAAGDVDTAVVTLATPGGAFCQITNSRRCSYGYDQRIEAFGALGVVRAENVSATRVETGTASGFLREPPLRFFQERYADAYRRELDAFLVAVSGKADDRPSALASAEDGVRALELAEAAERSLRERRTIDPAGDGQ